MSYTHKRDAESASSVLSAWRLSQGGSCIRGAHRGILGEQLFRRYPAASQEV